MFEDRTFDSLLAAGKKQVSDTVIKTEGSLIHNAIAALAYELEKLYIQADYIMRQANPAEADYDSLVTLAAARAVYPDMATHAQVRMVADTDVPVGARFSLAAYNYIVLSALEDVNHSYLMQCEETGSGANGLLGQLTPITYVEGLTEAVITEILVAGKNASTQNELYQKYIDSFKENSFGGNVAEYKKYLTAFHGIGGAKIYPVWAGPGTVKGVLLGADYAPVSDYLIAEIRQAMSPSPEKGYGIAPIGHTVTIESAEGVIVNLATQVTFKTGYSWAMLRTSIEEAIDAYFLSVRKEWTTGDISDSGSIYISRVEAAVLDVTGVLDIMDTTINGSADNLILTPDQVPMLGTVTAL